MTEIDLFKFREADKIIEDTINIMYLAVKKHYEENENLVIEVSKETLEGYNHGDIISFSDDVQIGELKVTVNFSKTDMGWKYEINSEGLNRKYLSPTSEFAFHGQINVMFIISGDDVAERTKMQIIKL